MNQTWDLAPNFATRSSGLSKPLMGAGIIIVCPNTIHTMDRTLMPLRQSVGDGSAGAATSFGQFLRIENIFIPSATLLGTRC